MTVCREIRAAGLKVISIHMPHTWHDAENFIARVFSDISIHMPHTWHDADVLHNVDRPVVISIHMPHTWHDT